MRIYLAGGMRSGWQDIVRQSVPHHIYYDPRDHNLSKWTQYSAWDFGMIRKCDWMFSYFEECNPSGYGLCGEMGYGKGLGKGVIFVDEIPTTSDRFRYLRLFEWLADVYFINLQSGIDFLYRLPKE